MSSLASPTVKRFGEQTYYEMLGVSPRASKREIQAAFLRLDSMYRPDSLSLHSLLEAEEIEAIRELLRQAKEVMLNEVARRAYDRQLVEGRRLRPEEIRDGAAAAAAADEPKGETDPAADAGTLAFPGVPPAEIPEPPREPAAYDGASLRAFREGRGVAVEDLCRITKISRFNVECIESGRHDKLPARVYLRGFLRSYADVLGLDPDKTAEEYLKLLPA